MMITPGALLFVGAAVVVFGLSGKDPLLFWLGFIFVVASLVMLWRNRS